MVGWEGKLELPENGFPSFVRSFPSSSLGTRSGKLQLPLPALPFSANLYQTLPPRIVPGTGIPPVISHIDIPAFDRVLMDILQLLPQHLLAFNNLRMTAFFPNLVVGFSFVPAL